MKKATLLLITLSIFASFPVQTEAAKTLKTRTISGTYYDYLTVVTDDGKEWFLPDGKDSPYLIKKKVKYNGRSRKVRVAKFKSGQKVRVKFDTRVTRREKDDIIISVKAK